MQRHSDRKAPVYTSRIPASQFNDAEAKAYTESCVRSLVQSKAYKSYLRHIDYKDYFIFLWLLSGFFIVAVLYFHILVFVGDHQNIFSLSGVEESGIVDSSAQKGIRIAALLVALYVLPCVVIKSFVNVFWEQDDRGRKTYTFFFFLSLAIVSYGGEELHHPPFLTTLPSLRWQEWLMEGRHVSLSQMLLHAVVRALPLQGYFLAGYAVSIWYTSHWKKMWHLPLPLLSVPLLVGAVGTVFWRAATLLLPLFYTEANGPTDLGRQTWELLRTDPSAAVPPLKSAAESVLLVLRDDAVHIPFLLGTFPPAALYAAGFGLSLLLFIVSVMVPVIDFVCAGLLRILPLTLWQWLLVLCSSTFGLVVSLRAEPQGGYHKYTLFFAGVVFALLYNGFVVRRA